MYESGLVEDNEILIDKNHTILSVLPVLGQPRDAKRISMLQASGFSVEVIAFHRNHHKGRIPECPITSLGKIENGHYIRRICSMMHAIPSMRRAIQRNQLIYASGPDMALLAIIANIGLGRPVIFEVGDIRRVQVSTSVTGRLVRIMDRLVAKFSELLVVTAPEFIEGYYRKWLNAKTPAIVLENKLEKEWVKIDRTKNIVPKNGRPLTIGYFGVLRCNWSWEVLETLALSRPDDIKIIVAGHILTPSDLAERITKIPNIEFRGEYQSPLDLPSLYCDVDLVWACYPPPEIKNDNWRWAQMICRSNRFYESCYFKKPIISVKGSGDAKEVEYYQIGKIISDQSIDGMLYILTNITEEELYSWDENLSNLPESVYQYTTEINDLRNKVKTIIDNSVKNVNK